MNKVINIDKNAPIGIFDSGLGGITVLGDIVNILPNEKIIYVGDEAHFPYGEKSVDDLHKYCLRIGNWLVGQGVKFIVIACNTATAASLDYLNRKLPIPVIGVVNAGVKAAYEATKNKSIGILATKATIKLGFYKKKLLEIDPEITVVSVAAPKFVQFVENNLDEVLHNPTKKMLQTVSDYTQKFKELNCDSIVMGCTHFPPLIPLLKNELGSNINFVSPSKKTAEELVYLLKKYDLCSCGKSSYYFYTTGNDYNNMKKFWHKQGEFNTLCV